MSDNKVIIRKFKSSDRKKIRRISSETAFSNIKNVPHIDRKFLADVLTLYYTDYEPASVFIAEIEGNVAGYLLGCLDTKIFRKKMFGIICLKIIPGFISGRYRVTKDMFILMCLGLTGILKGEKDPAIIECPAHLHINVRKESRRSGAGYELMSVWLAYLLNKGVKGVHLSTHSVNKNAMCFFEKWGFVPYYRYKSSIWSYIAGKPVFTEIFCKTLAQKQ